MIKFVLHMYLFVKINQNIVFWCQKLSKARGCKAKAEGPPFCHPSWRISSAGPGHLLCILRCLEAIAAHTKALNVSHIHYVPLFISLVKLTATPAFFVIKSKLLFNSLYIWLSPSFDSIDANTFGFLYSFRVISRGCCTSFLLPLDSEGKATMTTATKIIAWKIDYFNTFIAYEKCNGACDFSQLKVPQ